MPKPIPMNYWGQSHLAVLRRAGHWAATGGKMRFSQGWRCGVHHRDEEDAHPYLDSEWSRLWLSDCDREVQLLHHDDFDCLDDLAAAGVIERTGKRNIWLTGAGLWLYRQQHKRRVQTERGLQEEPLPTGICDEYDFISSMLLDVAAKGPQDFYDDCNSGHDSERVWDYSDFHPWDALGAALGCDPKPQLVLPRLIGLLPGLPARKLPQSWTAELLALFGSERDDSLPHGAPTPQQVADDIRARFDAPQHLHLLIHPQEPVVVVLAAHEWLTPARTRDIATGVLSFGYTMIHPAYDQVAPGTYVSFSALVPDRTGKYGKIWAASERSWRKTAWSGLQALVIEVPEAQQAIDQLIRQQTVLTTL